MKTDLLFHPKGFSPDIDNIPTVFLRLDKHDNNERQLSPWSSEENRFLKPKQQFRKAKPQNPKDNSSKKRYQEKPELDPPMKGRSVQLKPLKQSQLSDEIVKLVRRQRRRIASKDHSELITLSMNRVEMNLDLDQNDQLPELKPITSNQHRHLPKQQPTRVKIAKKTRTISTKHDPPPPPFNPYDPFTTIKHDHHENYTRMTGRSSKPRIKLHHFHQTAQGPLLGAYTITGRTLQGEQALSCRGDPFKNNLRSSSKYRLVNETNNQESFLQRL